MGESKSPALPLGDGALSLFLTFKDEPTALAADFQPFLKAYHSIVTELPGDVKDFPYFYPSVSLRSVI